MNLRHLITSGELEVHKLYSSSPLVITSSQLQWNTALHTLTLTLTIILTLTGVSSVLGHAKVHGRVLDDASCRSYSADAVVTVPPGL